jgi:hypothetical protein
MLLVCPRCSGSLQPDARACPRCGLVLTNLSTEAGEATDAISPNGREPYPDLYPAPETVAQPGYVDQVAYAPEPQGGAEYAPPDASSYQVPMRPISRSSEPYGAAATTGITTDASALLVPRGAVEMLPNESVVFQLGALYLTNKRVILLAPSVLRLAFLRDVDAIGTLSERASGWSFFFGLILLGAAGAGVYFGLARASYQASFPIVYVINPFILAIGLALVAVYLLVNYFFWVKRTLFLSVGGRPLITVSITDWNARKLEGMDQFINIYSQVKDSTRQD